MSVEASCGIRVHFSSEVLLVCCQCAMGSAKYALGASSTIFVSKTSQARIAGALGEHVANGGGARAHSGATSSGGIAQEQSTSSEMVQAAPQLRALRIDNAVAGALNSGQAGAARAGHSPINTRVRSPQW